MSLNDISTEDQAEWNTYVSSSIDDQASAFLRAFVLDFSGDKFTEILDLAAYYKQFLRTDDSATSGSSADATSLEQDQLHRFLEKRGEVLTAAQLLQVFKQVDYDQNKRMAFLEYLLYKFDKTPTKFFADLRNPKRGGGEQLKQAIADYRVVITAREQREQRMAELEAIKALGGVKGMAAKNELSQMLAQSTLAANKAEITLAARKRSVERNAVDPFEEEQKRIEAEKQSRAAEEEEKRQESRAKLAAKASIFIQK